VRSSTTSYASHFEAVWGIAGDTPLTGDYDGDGRAEIAIWRPADGRWYVRWSSSNWSIYSDEHAWGLPGDTVMDADFDGDGRADLVAWRRTSGEWFIRGSASGYAAAAVYGWGGTDDVTVSAAK
jgi:hypothetical protein